MDGLTPWEVIAIQVKESFLCWVGVSAWWSLKTLLSSKFISQAEPGLHRKQRLRQSLFAMALMEGAFSGQPVRRKRGYNTRKRGKQCPTPLATASQETWLGLEQLECLPDKLGRNTTPCCTLMRGGRDRKLLASSHLLVLTEEIRPMEHDHPAVLICAVWPFGTAAGNLMQFFICI